QGGTLLGVPRGPRLSGAAARAAEMLSGTTAAHFEVTLSGPADDTVTVDYATADGTAPAGSDYDATAGPLTFAPGDVTKTVDVTVRGDALREANETFTLTLSNVMG